MSDWIFGDSSWPGASGLHGPDSLQHAPEYLMNDNGQLSVVSAAHSFGHHGSPPPPPPPSGGGSGSPISTLVGSSSGLEINLIWDTSVQTASNWSDIEHTVVTAAQIFTANFTNHAVLNIQVGFGEINGQALGAGALGESESLGYAVPYSTLTHALSAADAGLVTSGLMASNAVTAVTALAAKTFFVASAEAKALGLVNALSTAVDGYIGLAKGTIISFTSALASGQYDGVGVVAHEISEVMGRIGMEGSQSGYYTPLDLFRYSAAGTPDLTPSAGYFSTNLGATVLNTYNDPKNGGDAADWATSAANSADAFDAFGNPGVVTQVTGADLLEVASLGYQPAGAMTTVPA